MGLSLKKKYEDGISMKQVYSNVTKHDSPYISADNFSFRGADLVPLMMSTSPGISITEQYSFCNF